jgi:hypothetical protein
MKEEGATNFLICWTDRFLLTANGLLKVGKFKLSEKKPVRKGKYSLCCSGLSNWF